MMSSATTPTRPRATRWAWLLVAAFTLAVVAGILAIERTPQAGTAKPPGPDPLPVGTLAPGFHAPALWGGIVGLADYRGQPVVINFCSSWSPFCRQETPTLIAAAERYQNRIVFLSVDVDESEYAALNYTLSSGIPYPVIPDPRGILARRYGVRYLPTTIFIGRDGKLLKVYPGAFQSVNQFTRVMMPLYFPPQQHKAPGHPAVRKTVHGA
jgi:cytochrome c biogenesis protein CcmG/thiol:disulfide interchange protein DsbE